MHNDLIKERDIYKFDEDAQKKQELRKGYKYKKGRKKKENERVRKKFKIFIAGMDSDWRVFDLLLL